MMKHYYDDSGDKLQNYYHHHHKHFSNRTPTITISKFTLQGDHHYKYMYLCYLHSPILIFNYETVIPSRGEGISRWMSVEGSIDCRAWECEHRHRAREGVIYNYTRGVVRKQQTAPTFTRGSVRFVFITIPPDKKKRNNRWADLNHRDWEASLLLVTKCSKRGNVASFFA